MFFEDNIGVQYAKELFSGDEENTHSSVKDVMESQKLAFTTARSNMRFYDVKDS